MSVTPTSLFVHYFHTPSPLFVFSVLLLSPIFLSVLYISFICDCSLSLFLLSDTFLSVPYVSFISASFVSRFFFPLYFCLFFIYLLSVPLLFSALFLSVPYVPFICACSLCRFFFLLYFCQCFMYHLPVSVLYLCFFFLPCFCLFLCLLYLCFFFVSVLYFSFISICSLCNLYSCPFFISLSSFYLCFLSLYPGNFFSLLCLSFFFMSVPLSFTLLLSSFSGLHNEMWNRLKSVTALAMKMTFLCDTLDFDIEVPTLGEVFCFRVNKDDSSWPQSRPLQMMVLQVTDFPVLLCTFSTLSKSK